jgi:hypothetical protein
VYSKERDRKEPISGRLGTELKWVFGDSIWTRLGRIGELGVTHLLAKGLTHAGELKGVRTWSHEEGAEVQR